MKEEQIKQYLSKGYNLYYIKSINTIRDNITIKIETNRYTFYIQNKTNLIYTEYDFVSTKYLITDHIQIEYLLYRIETYKKRELQKIARITNLLNTLKI